MSSILPKSFSNVGRWAQSRAVDLEKFLKYYKDVIVKGREGVADVCQITPHTAEVGNNNVTQFASKQTYARKWIPQLQNFRSTLKGDAAKLALQLSYRNNTSANSFFRNNILWRQARKGHLIAFAGLFLFQEENQESTEKFHSQFQIYENVCKNIQNIFPSYEDKKALSSDSELNLDRFQLKQVKTSSDHAVTFNARLLPEEDDIVSCPSSEFFDDEDVWSIVPSINELSVQEEFEMKAILPGDGVRKVSSIVKNCEHELLCGGIDVHDVDKYAWRNDTAGALPPHPNVLKIERVFCDRLPEVEVDDSSICSNRSLDQALYLVTRRYENTLSSYLKEKKFEPQDSVLVITQLLEAIAHLERHNVVHRYISAENVQLDFDKDDFPRLVLGEFEKAYCAASRRDLKVPFQHPSLDTRVQDLASQAPEVSKATAGRFRSVDYTKSDAWMAGCVAYEVLVGRNPFREPDENGFLLDSRTYKRKDLVNLKNATVPDVVKIVVEMLLDHDPKKRLSASEAADILHLELFASPLHQSICEDTKCEELRNWLNAHCAEAIVRQGEHSVPFQMCQSFFNRLNSYQLAVAFRYWVRVRDTNGLY